MHGIQHLFRQHALEKQTSTDSWHSAQSAVNNQAHLQQHYQNNNGSPVEGQGAVGASADGEFSQGNAICYEHSWNYSVMDHHHHFRRCTDPSRVQSTTSSSCSRHQQNVSSWRTKTSKWGSPQWHNWTVEPPCKDGKEFDDH